MIDAQTTVNKPDYMKDRLAGLSEASISILENTSNESALQKAVDYASKLTAARYGALLAFHESGNTGDYYTYGLSAEQREHMALFRQGLGLPGMLKDTTGPVRSTDITTHPDFSNLPSSHPEMKTFLGVPVNHGSEHVGNLYLTEKEGGEEFTEEDEFVASMLATLIGSSILTSRRYEEVRRSRSELETLMDISPVAVSVFDARKGEVVYLNHEGRRILGALGIPDEELDNLYSYVRTTRTDGREIPFTDHPGTRALLTGEAVKAEEIVIHLPNGNSFTTLVSCVPFFSESGEITSLLSVMQDMTPLEEMEQKRGEFLGRVSEELRTPLATIKGSSIALKSILDSGISPEANHLLRIIDQQSDLMRSQVNSLIELTDIETGTLSVTTEPTDVVGLLGASCGDYLKDHAAVVLQLDVQEGLPRVMADNHRISQVLHNFLRQAAKYSNESSPVRVSASMIDIYVAISVSVKGVEITEERSYLPSNVEKAPYLLSRLNKAYNTKSAIMTSPGEGLALSFCRGVVEAHGGRVRMEADDEKGGMTMTFTLQSVEVEEDVSETETQLSSGEASPHTAKGTRIVVGIEDQRLLALTRKVLADAGYEPMAAPNLFDIEQLAAKEEARLIVLDIVGREEDSFRILRNIGSSLNIPAIVLCERDDEDYVVRAFEMGADGYMVKPFSSSELLARIKATLRRMSSRRESNERNIYQLGDVRINYDERTVAVSGELVQLTATEYRLLSELSKFAGRILTQDEILHRVWGPEYSGESQLLRSYVKSVRQKLGDDARNPTYIFTEHGIGYRMAKANAPAAPIAQENQDLANNVPSTNGSRLPHYQNGSSFGGRW